MSGFGRDGDCYMVSYLDPKLAETNEVYDKLPEYLEQFDQDERSMDRYVIGAISEMDIPKNPAALGVRGLTAYLSGITREQLQKERDEVIDTDAKEIRALVPYAKAVLLIIALRSGMKQDKETAHFYNGTIIVVAALERNKYGKQKNQAYCTGRTSKRGKSTLMNHLIGTKDCDYIKKASDN